VEKSIQARTPRPGEWWLRLQHVSIGAIDFSSVQKPTVSYGGDGRTIHLCVDENFYVLPVEGLKVIWRLYMPRDGEAIPIDDAQTP
jgi:hypothetical protein